MYRLFIPPHHLAIVVVAQEFDGKLGQLIIKEFQKMGLLGRQQITLVADGVGAIQCDNAAIQHSWHAEFPKEGFHVGWHEFYAAVDGPFRDHHGLASGRAWTGIIRSFESIEVMDDLLARFARKHQTHFSMHMQLIAQI